MTDIRDTVTLVGPMEVSHPFSEPVIYVDGGVRHRGPTGWAVGDGDSSAGPDAMDLALPREKDESDLSYVLRHIPAQVRTVYAYGFLGGRRDHEWLNLGELHRFLDARQDTCLFLDTGRFFAAGEYRWDQQGVFSLLAFAPVHLELDGACQYSIGFGEWPLLTSRGLGNVGSGELRLRCEGPVLIWGA